jgi:F420-non-reducing hydrogenase small subunit
MKDNDKIEECDIALVEGCVTEENQIRTLKQIRKKSKQVIALGTCAAFGGIVNLNNDKRGDPISDHIEIDGMIPGCPPPSKLLGNALFNLLENKPIELSNKNLCYDCPLRGDLHKEFDVEIDSLIPNDEMRERLFPKCFLEYGILCLGPITREGCDCECIKLGIPCEGCMGPIEKDYTASLINFLSLLKLSKDLRNYEGLFFKFSKPKKISE